MITHSASDTAAIAVENGISNLTLRQKAYDIIQNKLLSGEIRAGDLVSELALAEAIGMSRTPVREAIGQLEIEGLFDKVPRVGTLVRLPEPRELSEMYEVREALESHAASVATHVLSASQLAEMEGHQRELVDLIEEITASEIGFLPEAALSRFFKADIGFHDLVVGATENRRTSKIVSEFRVVQRVFEYGRMAYNLEIVGSAAREHGEVLDALKRGDADQARFAMAAHIRSSRDHAMKRFAVSNTASDSNPNADQFSSGSIANPVTNRLKQRPRRRVVVPA